ncbi:hypothetical protein F4809DRAFT_647414 [Biscogniauxia mediterranea]|nr:hypothetical protein F4809DRAFT_647414 [Biscogniauxia mediterranea]
MLNISTPPTARRAEAENYEVTTSTIQSENNHNYNDAASASASASAAAAAAASSSPLAAHGPADDERDSASHNQENVTPPSPSKQRHSRIMSGTELSPLKILSTRGDESGSDTLSPEKQTVPAKPTRKIPPVKRFPVKVNSNGPSPEKPATQAAPAPASAAASPQSPPPQHEPQPQPQQQEQTHQRHIPAHEMTLEDALRQNDGLATAIKIFEDEDTLMQNAEEAADADFTDGEDHHIEEGPNNPDDTMISTLSSFSAVPNMTMFARLGHSPAKFGSVDMTPSASRGRTESPVRSGRPATIHESPNASNLLMDFTEQISSFSSRYASQSPNRKGGRSSMNPSSNTPQRRQSNLLDFDIPPLPTPRSIPTVTPRELESLKSAFLSEISSLKASLSGKEAEVSSLKTAVGDAEKRVGETMEQLREAQCLKDVFAEEKDNWERRGREMENVLRKVKEEIMLSQREREELESKFEESEKRREAAEMMAQEAESKMAGMRAGKTIAADDHKTPEKVRSPGAAGSREVEIAVERVARELHALYKSKHETKVAALKKSYENRWEKKVRELESRIEGLAEENDRLRAGRDATLTRTDPNQSILLIDEERKAQAVKDSAQIKELNAEIERLEAVMGSIKADNSELRQLLERERVEKGELVQLAEEMMSMQQSFIAQTEEKAAAAAAAPPPRAASPAMTTPVRPKSMAPTTKAPQPSPVRESLSFRSSMNRASGLRAPNSVKKPTESRIGGTAAAAHNRGRSAGASHGGGLPRPGSGLGSRSGILSSIERMGSHRPRGD